MLFRYTETPLKTGFLPQGSCALAVCIWGIRKTVPFRTPAVPAAIRSAFMIEADQTLTGAVCPQMTLS